MAAVIRTQGSEETLKSNFIIYTPEGIPYLDPEATTYLDPTHSQAIGMVLVRGIDVKRRRLQLLTPIPSDVLQKVHDDGKMFVLLSGKFDTPGWAYTEEHYIKISDEKRENRDGQQWQNQKDSKKQWRKESQRRDIEEEDDDEDEDLEDNTSRTLQSIKHSTQVPWIEIVEGHEGRGVGARVWRVRRDLGRNGDGG
jgi:polynucleotide 5'-hydroxyl-kinase GRC3/NOL9